jgi:phosphatidylglycerol:prolipoprotein diacylglycerol transferase
LLTPAVLRTFHLVIGDVRVVVSAHGLAAAVGFLAGAMLMARRAQQSGPALMIAAVVTASALAGSRLLFHTLHGDGAGLASMGGIAAGLAAAWAVGRLAGVRLSAVLDGVAPAGLLGLGIGRIGCFLAGCCYGRPTALPWGVIFPDLGPPARHPLQLYSAAGDLLLVAWLISVSGPPGAVARRACVGFGLLRAALEVLRDPGATDALLGRWLTIPQAGALALATFAAVSANPCVAGRHRLCLGARAAGAYSTEDPVAWGTRNR